METIVNCRARDGRKIMEPQRTQRALAAGSSGRETSGFQISHCEKFEGGSSKVGEAQCWELVELAPPTRKAKPGVEDAVCRRIVRNARKDKKTILFPSDLSIKSIKAKQTKSDQIRPIKRSGSNQGGSGQSNKGELSKIKANHGQSNRIRSNPSNQSKRG
jgi:hypothetical protein